MRRWVIGWLVICCLLAPVHAVEGPWRDPRPSAGPPSLPAVEAPPFQVFRLSDGQSLTLDAMLDEMASRKVVFVGENHNDANTHRLQLMILEGLFTRHPRLALALEMFERDVQPVLDNYLSNQVDEAMFLAQSRPWPNYPKDYRPLVEFARANSLPVLASNVPRPLASRVAREGLDSLKDAPETTRAWFAADIEVPEDDYFKRFMDAMMGMHGAHGPAPTGDVQERLKRMYHAQVLKDETMAESVSRFGLQNPDTLVLHINGAFHSDYGLGTVSRTARRLPDAPLSTVKVVPVPSLDKITLDDYSGVADYVIFTPGADE